MPNKYVFPGGRVEPADVRVPSASELRPHCEARLQYRSRRKARALALAAIRETFEETGLIAGVTGKTDHKVPVDWLAYFSTGAIPDLAKLTFIGRAITPPGRTRRFDARFFLASASETLIGDANAADSVELLNLHWLPIKEAMKLDIPIITRMMLEEVLLRLSQPGLTLAPPFVRQTSSGFTRGRIEIEG